MLCFGANLPISGAKLENGNLIVVGIVTGISISYV